MSPSGEDSVLAFAGEASGGQHFPRGWAPILPGAQSAAASLGQELAPRISLTTRGPWILLWLLWRGLWAWLVMIRVAALLSDGAGMWLSSRMARWSLRRCWVLAIWGLRKVLSLHFYCLSPASLPSST